MSDISIPGVSSKYGTQKIIQDLVKVESSKLVKMEDTKKEYEDEKVIWQNLNKRMQTVRDSARVLFGFNNPFGSKVGSSSDEKSLTVTANRTASDGTYTVKILNPASNDRFLSSSLPLDTQIPAGQYSFQIGDKTISVNFKGGKVQNFVDTVNLKSPTLLKASVIRDTADTQIFQLETIPVGEKNKLQFQGSTQDLMTKLGVVGPPATLNQTIQDKELSFGPGEGKTWKFDSPLKIPKDAVLQLQVSVEKMDENSVKKVPPEGFAFPEGGQLTFKDVQLNGSPMKGDLPSPPVPETPKDVRDMNLLRVESSGKNIAIPELPESATPTTFTFPLGSVTDTMDSFQLQNNNTLRTVKISGVQVTDPTKRNDFLPLHPQSQASDANLEFDGIKIKRDSNTVSDVIPGVTLNLLAPSKDTIELKVEPDRKGIKDSVITFLATYNRLLTDILVLTSYAGGGTDNTAIIQEANNLSDEEKKTAEKNLGKFQGDLGLNQIKNALQRTLMNPYPTGTDLTLLAQAGISTNSSSGGDTLNTSKLRGYLEMDEQKFDAAVLKDIDSVRKLFGNSTDGTLIVNTGAAFGVDEILKPSTQLGGLNTSHISTLDTQIKAQDKQMTDYKDYLVRYQQDLKVKYGQMESALQSMQKNSAQLNGQNNPGN